jgi:hypothetical protein
MMGSRCTLALCEEADVRAVFPLEFDVGRRSAMRWIAPAMIGAVIACGGSAGSADSGQAVGGGGRGGRGGGGTPQSDADYGRTFVVHTKDCDHHASVISDTLQRRYFLSDCLDRARAAVRARAAFTLAGEMMLTIPEYHDEQAFPVGAGKYGPVASFYASPFLGTFRDLWRIAEHGPRGMLAAVIDVKAANGVTTLDAPYDRLGLKPGLNCLWLVFEDRKWSAYVTQTPLQVACDHTTPRRRLAVRRSKEVGFGKDDYPPVARFTEAATNAGGDLGSTVGQPLLGISCVDKWCEIGPAKPDSVTPDFEISNPIGGIFSTREHRIKGWHDEQWLAIEEGGQLVPKFRASFVPAKRISEKPASDFKAPAWVSVAKVFLSDDPPNPSKYLKLGLKKGWNELMIQGEGQVWKGHWVNGGVTTVDFDVERVEHHDAAVPGTARFRYQTNDDSMWAPCGQACCRVVPEI